MSVLLHSRRECDGTGPHATGQTPHIAHPLHVCSEKERGGRGAGGEGEGERWGEGGGGGGRG